MLPLTQRLWRCGVRANARAEQLSFISGALQGKSWGRRGWAEEHLSFLPPISLSSFLKYMDQKAIKSRDSVPEGQEKNVKQRREDLFNLQYNLEPRNMGTKLSF